MTVECGKKPAIAESGKPFYIQEVPGLSQVVMITLFKPYLPIPIPTNLPSERHVYVHASYDALVQGIRKVPIGERLRRNSVILVDYLLDNTNVLMEQLHGELKPTTTAAGIRESRTALTVAQTLAARLNQHYPNERGKKPHLRDSLYADVSKDIEEIHLLALSNLVKQENDSKTHQPQQNWLDAYRLQVATLQALRAAKHREYHNLVRVGKKESLEAVALRVEFRAVDRTLSQLGNDRHRQKRKGGDKLC